MTSITDRKKITYADYLKIDGNNRYEIFNGELLTVPAPSTDHQEISRNIGSLIWSFVKQKGIGKVFNAPVDVVFDDDEVFQPDIVFIKTGNQHIIKKSAIKGIPDLIVEIVSPSSAFYDMVEKKEVYRKYGVKEYWLVFPDEKVIEIFILGKEGYVEFCKSKKKGMIKSNVLEGLEIDSKDVFE